MARTRQPEKRSRVSRRLAAEISEELMFLEQQQTEASEEEECCLPTEEQVLELEAQVNNMTDQDGKVLPARQANTTKGKDKPPANAPEGVTQATPVTEETGNSGTKLDYLILAHLKKIPALLSVYDVLTNMPEVREALIKALQNPELYRSHLIEAQEVMYAKFAAMVKFTDEDLMLGTTKHNRPLYIRGQLNKVPMNRVLIDPGSAVNLIPYMTVQKFSFNHEHLQQESVIVQVLLTRILFIEYFVNGISQLVSRKRWAGSFLASFRSLFFFLLKGVYY